MTSSTPATPHLTPRLTPKRPGSPGLRIQVPADETPPGAGTPAAASGTSAPPRPAQLEPASTSPHQAARRNPLTPQWQ